MEQIVFAISIITLSYAGDARFAGMGNLSFIIQDDLHQLNLYDFAEIPAGFFGIDSSPSIIIRGSGLKETWHKDSLDFFALGQAFPRSLIDYAPLGAVDFYQNIPQFPLIPNELIYTSPVVEPTYDEWGNYRSPQSWRIHLGYSQLTQGYIGDTLNQTVRTPEFYGIYARPISPDLGYGLRGDFFYSAYNSSITQDNITLMPPGGCVSIVYKKPWLNIGFGGEYHYPMFMYKSGIYTEEFNGHAVSPILGSVIKIKKLTWAGVLKYRWMSLAGTHDTSSLGKLKIVSYTGRSTLLYNTGIIRTAITGEYDNKTPIFRLPDGSRFYDTVWKDYIVGLGAGAFIKKLTIALEGRYKYNLLNDRLADNVNTASDYIIKFGAELGVIKNLFLRGGYNYNQIDPDLNQPDDNTKIQTITAGLGINIIQNTRLDIAYNYKSGKLEQDPEERIADHYIYLYLRHNLKTEEFGW